MGAFKPLLPFGDRTVIECCVDHLGAAGIDEIVVVVGHCAEDVRQHLKHSQVRFAANPDPDSEMSASIALGVEALGSKAKALMVALVDHPAVPPEVIQILIDEWKRGATLIQPEHAGRRGHPVLIDLTYRDELVSLDPAQGLRALFAAHRERVRRISVASPYVARDMDTWEDYQRLHKDVFGVAPKPV